MDEKEKIEKRMNELKDTIKKQQSKINEFQQQINQITTDLNQMVANFNYTRGALSEKALELKELEKENGDTAQQTGESGNRDQEIL